MIRSRDDLDQAKIIEEGSWRISVEPFSCFHIPIWIRWSTANLSLGHDELKWSFTRNLDLIDKFSTELIFNVLTWRLAENKNPVGDTSSEILAYSKNSLWSLFLTL